MTSKIRLWTMHVAVAAVASLLAYLDFVCSPPVTFQMAVKSRYIDVQIQATNAEAAFLTISRSPSAPRDFVSFTIPAGTLIVNKSPGSQRLRTARSIYVAFGRSIPSAASPSTFKIPRLPGVDRIPNLEKNLLDIPLKLRVETYCVDQFKLQPVLESPLILAKEDEDDTLTEETDPVRKLVKTLADSSETWRTRQLAVWLVGGGYLDMSYGSVHRQLVERYRDQMKREMDAEMASNREKLRQEYPDLTEAQVEAGFERYVSSGALDRERDGRAEQMASRDLGGFVHDGRRVMEAWDSLVGERLFFGTAPRD